MSSNEHGNLATENRELDHYRSIVYQAQFHNIPQSLVNQAGKQMFSHLTCQFLSRIWWQQTETYDIKIKDQI